MRCQWKPHGQWRAGWQAGGGGGGDGEDSEEDFCGSRAETGKKAMMPSRWLLCAQADSNLRFSRDFCIGFPHQFT
jgi:hypothetical protein